MKEDRRTANIDPDILKFMFERVSILENEVEKIIVKVRFTNTSAASREEDKA